VPGSLQISHGIKRTAGAAFLLPEIGMPPKFQVPV